MIPFVLAAVLLINTTEPILVSSVEKPVVYTAEEIFIVSVEAAGIPAFEPHFIVSSVGCRDGSPPAVSGSFFPNPADPGSAVSIRVAASDPCGIRSLRVLITGPYSTSLNASGGTAVFEPPYPGNYSVFAEAVDDSDFRNTTRVFLGNLTVRNKCHRLWETFSGFGRPLKEEAVSLFFNSSMDPDCVCSKAALGLTGFDYYLSISSTDGSIFLEKKCPSKPVPGSPTVVRERYSVFRGKVVKVTLAVFTR